MADNRIPIVCVVGPTASGKTSLSIKLAQLFDGEIVSADSMQIYKGMDIATAKPTVDEMCGIKHHLMDFLDAEKSFSVAQYCDLAHSVIRDIHSRNKLPILVGGTGLYVDSLLNNITFAESDSDDNLRKELQNKCDLYGVDSLLCELNEFDPETAEKLSVEKNTKRIIRAIEVYRVTGVTMSEHNRNSKLIKSPYKVVKIGLTAIDRQYLYDRINLRVDIMLQNGLLDEVLDSKNQTFSNTSSMAIGHKELLPYINGEDSLENCVENLKMSTRRYAKRQLTWFRRDEDINWINIDTLDNESILQESVKIIKKVLFNEEN